jgi:hypothetical protein
VIRSLPFLLLALLAGCGSLPRPFEGNPGAVARHLAQPPATKLVVDPPAISVLPPAKAALFATALADALASQEVPAVSEGGGPSDWHINLDMKPQGATLLPLFPITDEKGEQAGIVQGQPVSTDLWAHAQAETLRQVAVAAAPDIAGLLTRIEAARLAADPNSLVNRAVRLYVPRVTGAPGDGDDQLTRQMKSALVAQSLIVDPNAGDFTVAGQVAVVKQPASKTDRVEIQWVVSDQRGERGRVVQLNDVQTGLLDRNWGDVAVVVAEEAAAGIKDVVARQVGTSSK